VPALRDADPLGAAPCRAAADDVLVPALSGSSVTTIDVECRADRDGWRCRVGLTDARGTGEHRVTVRRADLERLAPGASEPDDLVRRSFEFLLEREPRSSILREFELTVIGRYFSEYESTIAGRSRRSR
jgi:hypothetical protein